MSKNVFVGLFLVGLCLFATGCRYEKAPVDVTTVVTVPATQPEQTKDNDYGSIDFDDPFDLGF